MRRVILVTGASGQLGSEVISEAAQRGLATLALVHRSQPPVRPHDHLTGDLLQPAALARSVAAVRPAAIVHCAAWTDLGRCEHQPFLAHMANSEATRRLSLLARELVIPLVFVSTDFVFDGREGDYREEALPHPLNEYGKTKAMAERHVIACGGAVVRSTFYGQRLLDHILQSLRTGTATASAERRYTPIAVDELARVLLDLLRLGRSGTFHAASHPALSPLDLARLAAGAYGFTPEAVRPSPPGSRDGVERPRDSSLDGGRLDRLLGRRFQSPEEGVSRLCRSIHSTRR